MRGPPHLDFDATHDSSFLQSAALNDYGNVKSKTIKTAGSRAKEVGFELKPLPGNIFSKRMNETLYALNVFTASRRRGDVS